MPSTARMKIFLTQQRSSTGKCEVTSNQFPLAVKIRKCSCFIHKLKFEIFIVSHVIEIQKFLFFLQTKNFKINTYIIFFCNWEFKNLYFFCKLKSAVFYFYSRILKILFFSTKRYSKISLFSINQKFYNYYIYIFLL